MRRRFLALAVVVGVLVAGCSSGHRSAAPTTTSSARLAAGSPNPDVIPAVITPAYVNAVFAVLNHVYGNATRELVAAHTVTPAVEADLRAIFAPGLYSEQVRQAKESLQGAIQNVRPDPGDGVTTVRVLMSASRSCIFAQTVTRLTQVLEHPAPTAASEYYELTLKSSSGNWSRLNPTPWVISYNAAFLTPTAVTSRCSDS